MGMTREETTIQSLLLHIESLEETVKALEKEHCEDCVSRKEVLELFAKNADAVKPYSKTWDDVKDLPSVTPTRKKGKWVKIGEDLIKCSLCGRAIRNYENETDFPYCHCGAEMESEE